MRYCHRNFRAPFHDPMPKKKKKTVAATRPAIKYENPAEETGKKSVKKNKSVRFTPERKRKIKGGMLVLIGLFALAFIGFFLFGKLFAPQDLAEITPAEKTVGVFELMIDANHAQVRKFYGLLGNYAVYKKENIIALLEEALPYDYEEDLYPWLGRKIGAVLYEAGEAGGAGNLVPVYFVECRDRNAALEFLKKRRVSENTDTIIETAYNGAKIYSFAQSQKAVFVFVNNYLVIAENEKIIKNYLDHMAEGKRLSDDPDYVKVVNNLPRGGIAFGYVNLIRLFETLENDPLFVSKKGQDLLVFKPYLSIFRAEGLSVFADNDRFTAQTFTYIDNEALQGEGFITFDEKYPGKLLRLAGRNPVILLGGHDLTKEIKRIKEIFNSGSKTPALVFEGMLEAQKQAYFGKEILLERDIFPLLTGEYLFTVENSLEDPLVSVFLELDDRNTDIPGFEKAAGAFVETSGIFTPKIREVELPDGTVGRELIASPEQVTRSTDKFGATVINTLKLGETGISVHYAVLEDVVVLCNDLENLKAVIGRDASGGEGGLTADPYYSANVAPVLRTADEILTLKLGALTDLAGLTDDKNISPYFVPFNNLTLTRNYFMDGISTIYLVEVI